MDQKMLEWVDGFMLGDGCISQNGSDARAVMQSSEREWCVYALSGLSAYEPRTPNEVFHKKTGKWAWQSATRNHADLTAQRARWYPNGAKYKQIPSDVRVTPMALLLWYLGDGSLFTGRGCSIQISTGDFPEQRMQELLLPKLADFGVKASIHGHDRVYVAGESTGRFFDVIGRQSPIKCYDYKFAVKSYVGKKNLSQIARELKVGRSWLAWAIKRFEIPTEKDGNRVWLTGDGEQKLKMAIDGSRARHA